MPPKSDSTPGPDERPAWFDASWDPEVPLVPAEDLDPRAQAVMQPGEQLLWTGRASTVFRAFLRGAPGEGTQGIPAGTEQKAVTARMALLVPLALVAVSTVILALVVVEPHLREVDPWTKLWGATFASIILVAILAVPVAAFLASRARARAVSAITDRRVLHIPQGTWREPVSYDVDPLSVEVIRRPDGSGDILFAGERWQMPPGKDAIRRVGFYRIADVRSVERLLFATVIRRQADVLPHPKKRQRGVGPDLQSSRPDMRARAIARLLYADGAALDAVVPGRKPSARMVPALGIAGMWRGIGVGGARTFVAALGETGTVREAAVRAFERLGKEGVVSLLRAWAVEDAAGRNRLLAGLGWVDRDALAAALAEVLLGPERANAVAVVEGVGCGRELREPVIEAWLTSGADVVSPLVTLLRDEGGRARWWAAEALGDPLAAGLADQVRAALGTDADPTDPPQAAVLAYLGDPAGVQALARALGERDDDATRVVADALGHLGASAAPALDALQDAAETADDGETRSRCRRAIKRIQDALGLAPAELEAASAPAGTGTEPEAAMPPEGTGTELTSAGPPTERQGR